MILYTKIGFITFDEKAVSLIFIELSRCVMFINCTCVGLLLIFGNERIAL